MMVVDRLFFDHCFLYLLNQQLAVLFSSFSQERQFNEPLPSNTHHHHHLFFPIVYHQQASISPLRPLPHRRYLNKNKNRRQSRGQVGGEGQKGRTTTFAIRGCCVTHLPIISFSSQNRKREKTGFVQSIAIIDSWTSSVRKGNERNNSCLETSSSSPPQSMGGAAAIAQPANKVCSS